LPDLLFCFDWDQSRIRDRRYVVQSLLLGIEGSFQGYRRDLIDGKRSDLAEPAGDPFSFPKLAKEAIR
jgi:hypothetical protein